VFFPFLSGVFATTDFAPVFAFTDRQKRFMQSLPAYSAGVLGSRAPKETCLAGEMVEIACLKIA
jgi:hypothetical protein